MILTINCVLNNNIFNFKDFTITDGKDFKYDKADFMEKNVNFYLINNSSIQILDYYDDFEVTSTFDKVSLIKKYISFVSYDKYYIIDDVDYLKSITNITFYSKNNSFYTKDILVLKSDIEWYKKLQELKFKDLVFDFNIPGSYNVQIKLFYSLNTFSLIPPSDSD
jgi:hypothetical protein